MKELLTTLIEKIMTILDPIKATMDFNSNHTGIAIGKTSEKDGLEIDWNVYIKGVDYTITPEEYTELENLINSIEV